MSHAPYQSGSDEHDAAGEPAGRRWALALESWGASILFHAALIVVFGLNWTTNVRPAGDSPEPLRAVELVVRRSSDDGPKYVDREQAKAEAAAEAAKAPPTIDVRALLGDGAPGGGAAGGSPVDISAALPKTATGAAQGVGPPSTILGGGGLLAGTAPKTVGTSGRGRTSVYGLQGEGFKFIYVFDRSGSMGGSGNRALNAAKTELLRSLDELTDLHQFQIIFYNENPTVMKLADSTGLMLATPENKQLARKFVDSISADGATSHEPALTIALRLAPDVIFFLTDADQPELSPGQLEKIKRLNAGRAVINTIEFGLGPKIRSENFLDRVATENGGRSAYIDISRR